MFGAAQEEGHKRVIRSRCCYKEEDLDGISKRQQLWFSSMFSGFGVTPEGEV